MIARRPGGDPGGGSPSPIGENGPGQNREVVLQMGRPGHAAGRRGPASGLAIGPVARRPRRVRGLPGGLSSWLIRMINPPRPAGVVLLGSRLRQPTSPCRTMPWATRGSRDRAALTDAQALDPVQPRQTPALYANPGGRTVLETADDWDGADHRPQERLPREPTLILVLALHGGSDADGAYLMPNRMKRPEDRLDMRKVIASMKELPPGKTKILVVEGAQVDVRLAAGNAPQRLRTPAQGARAGDPRRAQPLGPERLRRQISGAGPPKGWDEPSSCHYITEALRGGGAAGAPTGGSRSMSCTSTSGANVRRWAWAARGAVQEPVLLAGRLRPGELLDPPSCGIHSRCVEIPRRSTGHGRTAAPRQVVHASRPRCPAFTRRRIRRLDAPGPTPSAYSPMRWRTYGASLVRYEQLSACRRTEAAAAGWRAACPTSAQAIRKDRVLEWRRRLGRGQPGDGRAQRRRGRRARPTRPNSSRSTRPPMTWPPRRPGTPSGRARPTATVAMAAARSGRSEPTGRIPPCPGPGRSGQGPEAPRRTASADRPAGRAAPGRVALPDDARGQAVAAHGGSPAALLQAGDTSR